MYTALTRDFQIEFQTTEIIPLALLSLKVSYWGPTHFRNIGHINFYTDDQSNSTRIKVPCSLFTRAGPYTLHVEGNEINTTLATSDSHVLEHKLDVRWPNSKLRVTHEIIETYPTDQVNAVIEFIDFECPVDTATFEEVPSFQLELTYCGMFNIMCDSRSVPPNSTFPIQVIYGMQRSRVIPLNCEYFGLAGNYVLHLKPLPPLDSSLATSAFIKVIERIFFFILVSISHTHPSRWEINFSTRLNDFMCWIFPSFVTHVDESFSSTHFRCRLRLIGVSSTFSTLWISKAQKIVIRASGSLWSIRLVSWTTTVFDCMANERPMFIQSLSLQGKLGSLKIPE